MLKKVRHVKPFQYNTGRNVTDRRTDIIAISISHVNIAVLTPDKNSVEVALSWTVFVRIYSCYTEISESTSTL